MSRQMIGSIGIDISGSRAAIGLLEWSGGQTRQGSVGDGRRILVPVAATESAWGSQAAEAALAALPESARLADSLRCWQRDPWSDEFLSGLRRRLLSYLGQPESAGIRTHQLRICADPENAGDWATVTERLDAAGLPHAELVHPADALLCRWLAETPAQPEGPVLAVACSETATNIGLYTVRAGEDLAVRVDDRRRVPAGSGGWMTELAGDVLRRCRPGVPARTLLSLLDGADEFAALLRTGARAGEVEVPLEWAGPISQFMSEPLCASRADLVRRKSVMDWTVPVASAARDLLSEIAGGATVLVGGPGAAWPFVADTLARFGAVWESGDPALDLALGSCGWRPPRSESRHSIRTFEHTAPGTTAPGAGGVTVGQDGGERPWDTASGGAPAISSGTSVSSTTPTVASMAAADSARQQEDDLAPWERDEHR
jgi:hypothetical protein